MSIPIHTLKGKVRFAKPDRFCLLFNPAELPDAVRDAASKLRKEAFGKARIFLHHAFIQNGSYECWDGFDGKLYVSLRTHRQTYTAEGLTGEISNMWGEMPFYPDEALEWQEVSVDFRLYAQHRGDEKRIIGEAELVRFLTKQEAGRG